MKTLNVLFLCHGNKYRSPFAEAVLKSLQKVHDACEVQFEVKSAGFRPSGQRAAKIVRDFAAEHWNLDLMSHRSQIVTKELLEWANVIVYMDNGQLRRLEENWSEYLPKTRALDVKPIPDPAFAKINVPPVLRLIRSRVVVLFNYLRGDPPRQQKGTGAPPPTDPRSSVPTAR